MNKIALFIIVAFSASITYGSTEFNGRLNKQEPFYDVLITGGNVIDGTGSEPITTDVGMIDDRIVAIGDLSHAKAHKVIDATGKVVTPGFINMLSWAVESLVTDGRGLSDVVQGVTLEVFGEGNSMGPLTPASKIDLQKSMDKSPNPVQIQWTTLGEYLEFLETKGVSPNVASFIGATTVRINAVGYDNREPTADELTFMEKQVADAMQEGAMGVGSSLIYAPAFYAKTDELIALNKVAAQYGGMYITHMRNEGNQLLVAFDETLTIAKEAGIPAEVYHLKAGGKNNWPKMQQLFKKLEAANDNGLKITADMYTYPAGATGLDAAMPPWVQEGGYDAWAARLGDPAIRAKVITQMKTPSNDWDNLYRAAGADGILLPYFKNPALKQYTGMRLSDVAAARGSSVEDTIIDLVIADGTRVEAIYFLMSDENLVAKIKQPWVSFGSDSEASDPVEASKHGSTHPRAYGNFSRVLAKYVRDEKVISLQEAVRKLSGLPATNLKIKDRGFIKEGYYGDVLVFDPAVVQDHATFADPHKLSTGMSHVFINGVQVLADGVHTGATPGRVVRGPGWTAWEK
jgi:N-acyl-D-amino-acid deacylase